MFEENLNKWKEKGFSQYKAIKWLENCFDLKIAQEWDNLGFTVDDAKYFQKQGLSPITAKKLILNEIKNNLIFPYSPD